MIRKYEQACLAIRLSLARVCSNEHVYVRNQDELLEVPRSVRGFVVVARDEDISFA